MMWAPSPLWLGRFRAAIAAPREVSCVLVFESATEARAAVETANAELSRVFDYRWRHVFACPAATAAAALASAVSSAGGSPRASSIETVWQRACAGVLAACPGPAAVTD